MNLPDSVFSLGEQPCKDFQPKMEDNGYMSWSNRHVCVFCPDGKVSFCEKCGKDHHGYGYENCKRQVTAQDHAGDEGG